MLLPPTMTALTPLKANDGRLYNVSVGIPKTDTKLTHTVVGLVFMLDEPMNSGDLLAVCRIHEQY